MNSNYILKVYLHKITFKEKRKFQKINVFIIMYMDISYNTSNMSQKRILEQQITEEKQKSNY